jgi:hypothetical protein
MLEIKVIVISFLTSSVRYMINYYQDAMVNCLQKLGKPYLFITSTCNLK